MHIPKYRRHNLANCIFGHFGQALQGTAHDLLWNVVTDPNCFHCYIPTQTVCWNNCKQLSESQAFHCFWYTVCKCATHFDNSFLMYKCSWKIKPTSTLAIFKVSAIYCNIILQFGKFFFVQCHKLFLCDQKRSNSANHFPSLFSIEQSPNKTYQAKHWSIKTNDKSAHEILIHYTTVTWKPMIKSSWNVKKYHLSVCPF